MAKPQRIGGLHVDPAVSDFQKNAAPNLAALTRKQRADRLRVRVKYDLPPAMKEAVEEGARQVDTSASQFAMFLLGFALDQLPKNSNLRKVLHDAKVTTHSIRFSYNLELPDSWPACSDKGDRGSDGN
jgi:hypothetical protein